jgi:CubicO group peptidase (beta-lactamase class C family)
MGGRRSAVGNGDGLFAGRFLSCFLAALSACVMVSVATPVHAAGFFDRRAVDAAFDDTFQRYGLPGLAVGIVVDGEVVYVRTGGELAAGSGQAVDADTLFKVASNTKSMTTALLARLVDQGRLQWDDPVVKYLPDFRMHDGWVTREMQVRDLLIHNSGLGAGAGDLMLWPEPNLFTRGDVIRGLRYLKPVYSFRSRYAYDNSLYIVAGEVAAAAGGAPYDVLVRREVFEPLGMRRCQAGEWRRDAVGNVAQAHMRSDGRNVVIRADDEVIPDVPMMAAGGVRCSLSDMLAWVRTWLQPEGDIVAVDGSRWLSRRQREELWKTHMPMPLSRQMREWDRSHFSAYGYGWRLTDVDGTWKVSHTGTLAGMYSAVVLLPEKKTGFVLMANGEAGEARTVLSQVLVKSFTDPDNIDGNTVAHYAEWLARERGMPATAEATHDPVPRQPVSASEMGADLGRYLDPWFGEIRICPAGEGVRFHSLKSPKLDGDVMRAGGRLLVDWRDEDVDVDAWLDFSDAAGGTRRLRMAKTDPDADFSYDYEDLDFERVGECQ